MNGRQLSQVQSGKTSRVTIYQTDRVVAFLRTYYYVKSSNQPEMLTSAAKYFPRRGWVLLEDAKIL